MIVGPTVKWYIAGQFEWKKIKVATGFRNVRIFGGLYFDRLELYVEVSWVPFSDLTYKVLSSSRSYLLQAHDISQPTRCTKIRLQISAKHSGRQAAVQEIILPMVNQGFRLNQLEARIKNVSEFKNIAFSFT